MSDYFCLCFISHFQLWRCIIVDGTMQSHMNFAFLYLFAYFFVCFVQVGSSPTSVSRQFDSIKIYRGTLVTVWDSLRALPCLQGHHPFLDMFMAVNFTIQPLWSVPCPYFHLPRWLRMWCRLRTRKEKLEANFSYFICSTQRLHDGLRQPL